ncbi:MAG: hypothetical protein CR968_01465 [Flavobacteriia bacterium]|nr:MAG: hypothetical protein CR968_01465 [Flavobacteriia bacterium]
MNAQNQDKNNSRLIILILSILLALLAVFTIYTMKSGKDKVQNLTTEKEAIKQELDEKIEALNVAMTDNEAINSELSQAKSNLLALRDSVDQIKKMDRKTINYLNRRLKDLERVNQRLISEADSLRYANQQLSIENDSARADIQRKAEVIVKKEMENDSLNNLATQLGEKVVIGSALTAGKITTIAMKERRSGTLKKTNRARKVDAFRTNFVLRENPLATAGVKKSYVVVKDGMGNVVGEQGTFVNASGEELAYTDEADVDYTNMDVEVVLISNVPEGSLTKGDYTLEVYMENRLMGSTSITLK